jgi:magnesium transporter
VLGIINLDQNKIMKVFTLVSLMLMPPTLIASFFGMNIQFGWFIGHSPWTWVIVLLLMGVSTVVIFWIFKTRKMF